MTDQEGKKSNDKTEDCLLAFSGSQDEHKEALVPFAKAPAEGMRKSEAVHGKVDSTCSNVRDASRSDDTRRVKRAAEQAEIPKTILVLTDTCSAKSSVSHGGSSEGEKDEAVEKGGDEKKIEKRVVTTNKSKPSGALNQKQGRSKAHIAVVGRRSDFTEGSCLAVPAQASEDQMIRLIKKGVRNREQYHRQHRKSRRSRSRGRERENATAHEALQRIARRAKLDEERNRRKNSLQGAAHRSVMTENTSLVALVSDNSLEPSIGKPRVLSRSD
ncbi:expressed unknown protein [Seminavis robusta]|uniref:Uncharacterized protein n=1 Tax=Seminavis robusta TaxID=568900 RepID=A0A9N8HMQ5_9STRA|nr:expressed unknown protein [Seminavis robusta]|eukprot:Sro1019_g231940.1 n/a (272) ;mRNA; f:5233-6048